MDFWQQVENVKKASMNKDAMILPVNQHPISPREKPKIDSHGSPLLGIQREKKECTNTKIYVETQIGEKPREEDIKSLSQTGTQVLVISEELQRHMNKTESPPLVRKSDTVEPDLILHQRTPSNPETRTRADSGCRLLEKEMKTSCM